MRNKCSNIKRIGPKSKGKKSKRIQLKTRKKTLRNGRCSKGQLRTALLISNMLGGAKYEMEVTWDWLTSGDYVNMYLDIFFPEYNLAVEYHGEQHFNFPNFFHKTKYDFEQGRKRDRLKRKQLKENGIKYVEWKYNELFTDRRALGKLKGVGIERRKDSKPLRCEASKGPSISKVKPRRI